MSPTHIYTLVGKLGTVVSSWIAPPFSPSQTFGLESDIIYICGTSGRCFILILLNECSGAGWTCVCCQHLSAKIRGAATLSDTNSALWEISANPPPNFSFGAVGGNKQRNWVKNDFPFTSILIIYHVNFTKWHLVALTASWWFLDLLSCERLYSKDIDFFLQCRHTRLKEFFFFFTFLIQLNWIHFSSLSIKNPLLKKLERITAQITTNKN